MADDKPSPCPNCGYKDPAGNQGQPCPNCGEDPDDAPDTDDD